MKYALNYFYTNLPIQDAFLLGGFEAITILNFALPRATLQRF